MLARALSNNSSVLLAQQQVAKAQQLINEANAGGLPTIRLDFVDTLSSNKTFGTAGGGSNATGTLPGGGNIPVIIDTGGGNASGVTSSGGGGTATGAGSTSAGTTTTSTTTATGATTTNTVPTNTTLGSGGTTSTGGTSTGGTSTGGTSTGGTGTTGTGGTSTGFGTTGPTAQARPSSGLPPIMQQLASATHGGAASEGAAPAAAGSTGQPLKAHDNGTPTTGTGTGTGQLPGNGSLNNAITGHNNNYSAQVSVTQGIDIFNLVPAAEDVERLTRDFYVTDLQRVQNETTLSVKDQFFNVLRDQEQVVVYQEQVAADQESVRVTQAQVNAGSVAQFDLLTAQTTLSNAQQQLSSAQDTLTLAQDNLNNLLGVNPDVPFALAVPALPPLNQTFDKNQLTQVAYTHRPEIIQGYNNVKIARRLVKLAGVGLLPSLSLVGSGNYDGYTAGTSHDTASISAVLGVPLYDGGTTRAKVKEAEADLRSQQITLSQVGGTARSGRWAPLFPLLDSLSSAAGTVCREPWRRWLPLSSSSGRSC